MDPNGGTENMGIVLSETLLEEARTLLKKGAEFNARGFILIPSDSGTVHAVIAKSAGGIIPLALLRFAEKDFFIGIPLEEEVT